MNTDSKHKGDSRGVAVILVVGVLVFFLIFFLVVGIDFAYVYLARGEIQNAADSGSTAGAAKVEPLLDDSAAAYLQTDARREAWKFACENKAAGDPVFLEVSGPTGPCDPSGLSANDLNGGSNNPNGDIIVGHWREEDDVDCNSGWEAAGSGFFCRANGTTGRFVNAVKVVAKRTEGSPSGRVGLIFGGLVGWPLMNVSQVAVAVQFPPAILPLPMCLPTCDLETPLDGKWGYDKNEPEPILCTDEELTDPSDAPGQQTFLAPSSQADDPPQPGLAWTNFSIDECLTGNCNMPTKDEVLPYITGQKRPPDICDKHICTTNGTITPLMMEVEDQFEAEKGIHNIGGENIVGWRVFVPIVSNLSCGEPKQSCPGAQAGTANPYLVVGMADVLVTEVITTGNKGLRIIGLGAPSEKTYSITCNDGERTFTRNVNTVAGSSGICTDCSLPLPTDISMNSRLVR